MDNITKVLLAVTTVALVSVIVVNGVNSAKVVTALGSAYSGSLAAAEKG